MRAPLQSLVDDMKRTHAGAFPRSNPISAKRQEGRWALELLIALEQADLLYYCVSFVAASSRDLYVLMRTCKALRDAVYQVLQAGRAYLIPYNISLKNGGATAKAGYLTVYKGDSSWPSREDINQFIAKWQVSPPVRDCTVQLCPPVEIDQACPNARSWWAAHDSVPLLPVDMARTLAKEKKKREFEALAREAGLFITRPSYRLVLPSEPWH